MPFTDVGQIHCILQYLFQCPMFVAKYHMRFHVLQRVAMKVDCGKSQHFCDGPVCPDPGRKSSKRFNKANTNNVNNNNDNININISRDGWCVPREQMGTWTPVRVNRKGTNGVGASGVTANFMFCLTEGPCGKSR